MPEPTSDRASRPSAAAPGERAARPRVLLVVADSDLRSRALAALADGRVVEAVADGRAGLRAALDSPPEVVVADAAAGPELVSALRSDPRTQDVPIVLMTTRTGAEGAVEGLDLEADEY